MFLVSVRTGKSENRRIEQTVPVADVIMKLLKFEGGTTQIEAKNIFSFKYFLFQKMALKKFAT